MGFGNLFKRAVTALILDEMSKKPAVEDDDFDREEMEKIDEVLCEVEAMDLPDDFDDMTKDELEDLLDEMNAVLENLHDHEPYVLMDDLFKRWISATVEVEDRISSIEFYLDHCFDDEDETEDDEIIFY